MLWQYDAKKSPRRETNERKRVGDWKADTLIGKNHQGAIMTLDERKSKLRLAVPLQSKKAQHVKQAAIALLQPIKLFVETITFDNGKEFSLHEAIAKALGCNTYFERYIEIAFMTGAP